MKSLSDARGLAISVRDIESQIRYESALASLHSLRGDAPDLINDVIAHDPDCVAAHCLQAAATVLSNEVPGQSAIEATLDTLERLGSHANERERRHAAAARAWFQGDMRLALQRYGDLVIDYPRDSLALQVAHALDFRLGQREMLRDRVAQVLPFWEESTPGYGYVLGMYAFGLEENGEYVRAEELARRSLELEPDNASAIHAVAHVMEMQGRAGEGIEWLDSTRATWSANAGFSVHIAWHLALFHIDLDQLDAALAIYDALVAPSPSSSINGLVDASALLWRLGIRGRSPDSRWHTLAGLWSHHSFRGRRAFTIVHAVMAFTAAGRLELAYRVAALLQHDAATRTVNSEEDLKLAIPLTEAMQAFGRGQYARAVEAINTVRVIAHRCGGSVAQCDLIHLTLIEAALRSRKAQLARALAAERTARKPGSPMNQWLFARAAEILSGWPENIGLMT